MEECPHKCTHLLIPGETDSHRFICPYGAEFVQKIVVSYRQGARVVHEVEVTNIIRYDDENSYIDIDLSQSDTLKFKNNQDITAQLNVLLANGKRRTSLPITIPVGDQYKREVIF